MCGGREGGLFCFVFLFLPVEVINLELPVAIMWRKSTPKWCKHRGGSSQERKGEKERTVSCFEPQDPIIHLLTRTFGYISQ